MEIKTLAFAALVLLLSGCRKNERLDPEESTKTYISFSVDGKKYRMEHGSEKQHVSYFFGKDGNTIYGYKLAVRGTDSIANTPTFLLVIRNFTPVTKGLWVLKHEFPPTPEVWFALTHTISENPKIYREEVSYLNASIEVTELSDSTIKGVFSGNIESDAGRPAKETFEVTDGEFYVNRSSGNSDPYPF
ncbi:hypothetical protein [Dyadobacter frigoris]|uniref:Lipoprotein n=1 Tax=Dyadobacter frigoris TaxID=2576211 RepID=A0A4V6BM86_9BACT|nr:hypothetical protein [Dyadobacter frigoris]TKT93143.1 hypothetical protein FDK13_04620 [Dyadobacter frigoris]